MIKKILYILFWIAIVLFILYFFVYPIVQDGLSFGDNMDQRIQQLQEETGVKKTNEKSHPGFDLDSGRDGGFRC